MKNIKSHSAEQSPLIGSLVLAARYIQLAASYLAATISSPATGDHTGASAARHKGSFMGTRRAEATLLKPLGFMFTVLSPHCHGMSVVHEAWQPPTALRVLASRVQTGLVRDAWLS